MVTLRESCLAGYIRTMPLCFIKNMAGKVKSTRSPKNLRLVALVVMRKHTGDVEEGGYNISGDGMVKSIEREGSTPLEPFLLHYQVL